eukprot:TRINITY_DN27428_c0_g1_i1.p1 TRINITY_DN27428_c0_g1~~TRINITY_DN27428_c0_g1_i1.p1  ORF type:complete len:113 (+),score=11.71 TRINITY_DN27428_c0_g1_i1:354-692(+)
MPENPNHYNQRNKEYTDFGTSADPRAPELEAKLVRVEASAVASATVATATWLTLNGASVRASIDRQMSNGRNGRIGCLRDDGQTAIAKRQGVTQQSALVCHRGGRQEKPTTL